MAPAFAVGAFRAPARLFRNSPLGRWWKVHTSPTRFGKANSNSLPGRAGAVFSLADVVHFFADKLTRLGRRRFPLILVTACGFERLFFWHTILFECEGLAAGAEPAGLSEQRVDYS